MKGRFLTIAGLALLFIGISHPAYALKISPFKASMVPGSESSEVFYVENNSPDPAAVQVSVETWRITPDGTEINTDAEDEFTVFPAQIVLKARERRAVRVQWLGEGTLDAEKAYRVVAEQVPVTLKDTPDNGSGLKFLLRFKAAFYIGPAKPRPDVVVDKIETLRTGLARVTLVNKGTGHTLLRAPLLTIVMESGKSIEIKEDQLTPIAGWNIHAGGTRIFEVNIPSDAGIPKSASLTFESAF